VHLFTQGGDVEKESDVMLERIRDGAESLH
jgi:hypothetical protein